MVLFRPYNKAMRTKRASGLVCLLAFLAVPSLFAATSLPPLPKVGTAHLFPVVQRQVQEAYQAAIAHPMDPQANGKLGMLLDTYQQYPLAQVCYLRAHRLDPKSFDWAYDLGYVLFEQGQYTQAVEALREALKLRPDYVPGQLKLAESMLSAGQLAGAGKLYQQIVRQHSNNARAYYGLGRVQASQGNNLAAVQSLSKACELVPQYGAAQFALAVAYRKLGEQQKAAEHFKIYKANMAIVPPSHDAIRAAVKHLNHTALAHVRRGIEMAKAGDLQGAIQQHLEALQSDPQDLQAYINLIQLYARAGKIEKAEQAYHKAVALNPNRADCYYNYGVMMFNLHRYAAAEQAMKKSIRINPNYPDAHDDLGYIYAVQGHFDMALAEYQKALAERPNFRLARFHMGQIYANQGKYEQAVQEFRKILTPIDSSTTIYLYALGATYARAGDKQKAMIYMRRARDQAEAAKQTQLLNSIKHDLANLEQ